MSRYPQPHGVNKKNSSRSKSQWSFGFVISPELWAFDPLIPYPSGALVLCFGSWNPSSPFCSKEREFCPPNPNPPKPGACRLPFDPSQNSRRSRLLVGRLVHPGGHLIQGHHAAAPQHRPRHPDEPRARRSGKAKRPEGFGGGGVAKRLVEAEDANQNQTPAQLPRSQTKQKRKQTMTMAKQHRSTTTEQDKRRKAASTIKKEPAEKTKHSYTKQPKTLGNLQKQALSSPFSLGFPFKGAVFRTPPRRCFSPGEMPPEGSTRL